MRKLISVQDFQAAAKTKLSADAFSFLEDVADDGTTFDRNIKSFGLYKLKQRILQGKLNP